MKSGIENQIVPSSMAHKTPPKRKRRRRKQGYERKIKEEGGVDEDAARATGVDGFAALYRVLGLPERKLATASEIRAYHKRSFAYHPDKHPDDPDGAKEVLEIKAA